MYKALFFTLSIGCFSYTVAADDFFDTIETSRTPAVQAADNVWRESPWTSKAWLQQKTGWGYRRPAAGFSRDSADLTRTETELYGELDWRRDRWQVRLAGSLVQGWLPDLEQGGYWSGYTLTPEQRDARRWRSEISDSFLAWQKDDWWVKAGVQTLAWGESETQKVTDVLARRDQRWPGQEDLEALRLPVPTISMTWRNRLELVVMPSMPTDRQPAASDEFDPYIRLRNRSSGDTTDNPTTNSPTPNNPSPAMLDRRGHTPSWAARWHTRHPGLDMQWMLADVYSFETAPVGLTWSEPDGQATSLLLQTVTLKPWRQQVVGFALQTARGSWLLKTEQAWHHNTRLASQDPLTNWQAHDQWRAMAVAEYSGINDLTITGEFSWRYTHKHRSTLVDAQWQTGQALRVRYSLLNERLTLGGLALRLIGGQGHVLRASADWSMSDHWSVGLSLIEYDASTTRDMLYDYRHNDTLLLTLRWGLL